VCQGSLKNHDFCHSIRVKEFNFLVILSEVKINVQLLFTDKVLTQDLCTLFFFPSVF